MKTIHGLTENTQPSISNSLPYSLRPSPMPKRIGCVIISITATTCSISRMALAITSTTHKTHQSARYHQAAHRGTDASLVATMETLTSMQHKPQVQTSQWPMESKFPLQTTPTT